MPVAKYKQDKKSKLYYTYEKTGLFYQNGKPKYQKLRAKTIAALDDKVREYQTQQAFGVEPSKLTVDEWEKQWFAAYKAGCRESTKQYYKYTYGRHIAPAIGMMRLDQVKEVHLQKILSSMTDKYSVKTVSGVRVTLFSLFDTAQANRMISTNPAKHLKAAGKEPQKRRALTPQERERYLKACKTHPFGTFVAFLYFFGIRRGEALALCGSDISTESTRISKQHGFGDNNTPSVSAPKTVAGTRDIPIPTKAREYIDFSHLPDGHLFTGANGSPLSHQEFFDRWHSFIVCALGEGTDITAHSLRHNYCTMLFEADVDVMTAKRLMGHSDIQTTMRIYAHYTASMEQANASKVASIG